MSTVTARINKSSLNAKQKRQVKEAFRRRSQMAVLGTSYVHAQSNTTLASVSGFSVPVKANTTYQYEIQLYGTGNASGGLKFGVVAPTALSVYGAQTVLATAASAVTAATSVATIAGGVTAANVTVFASGVYKPGADGLFQIQAAQNASHASDSTLLTGSFVRLTEVMG
jgi:hypothetical protein